MSSRLAPRLFAAFVAVALVAVLVLAVAALVGADRGVGAAQQAQRQAVTDLVAAQAGDAYREAGGWAGADLAAAQATAGAAGARLVVRPDIPADPGRGEGSGPGAGAATGGSGAGSTGADVIVVGEVVGSVRLAFGGAQASQARDVAWTWIAAAAVLAMLVAAAAAWWVSRRVSAPLVALAGSARAFGAGDRAARAAVDGPGEIGEVARAFDDMADRVAQTEESRRRVAADIAHELRTPLAVLQAELEELRDGLAPATPQVLAALHDQSLRLGRVVEDLGVLAGTERPGPSLRIARVDLAELVDAVATAHRGTLAAAGIEVTTTAPGPVPAEVDRDRIAQVLDNLLANVERYCGPGCHVTVAVGATADGGAAIVVADDGPGIPADELPRVFDRFWRGSAAADRPGSGLGLVVVRSIVEAHGGQVQVASGPGGGTTVTVALPPTVRTPRARA